MKFTTRGMAEMSVLFTNAYGDAARQRLTEGTEERLARYAAFAEVTDQARLIGFTLDEWTAMRKSYDENH